MSKAANEHDPKALNRVGNSHDRLNQHQAKPQMGANKLPKGSQRSGAGDGIPAHKPRLAGKKLNKNQGRAARFNARSENGLANVKGGN